MIGFGENGIFRQRMMIAPPPPTLTRVNCVQYIHVIYVLYLLPESVINCPLLSNIVQHLVKTIFQVCLKEFLRKCPCLMDGSKNISRMGHAVFKIVLRIFQTSF